MANSNLDQLRKKLAKITRTGPVSRATWKPSKGENIVRIVPIKSNPADLFVELKFYYPGNRTVFSPRNIGSPDPVFEFGLKLREGGNLSKDEWRATKKFFPATRTYLPIIVRGKESEGIKWWGFGMEALKQIKRITDDDDYGDIFDVENGFDLKINYTPADESPKKIPEVVVTPRPRPSPLTTDEAQFEKWLENVPDLMSEWEVPSYEEMETFLQQLVEETTEPWSGSTGTTEAVVGAIENIATTEAPASTSENVDDVNESFERAFAKIPR